MVSIVKFFSLIFFYIIGYYQIVLNQIWDFFYVAFVRIYIKTDAKNIQQNMFRRLWCQRTRQQIFLKFKDMIYLAKTKTKENIHTFQL